MRLFRSTLVAHTLLCTIMAGISYQLSFARSVAWFCFAGAAFAAMFVLTLRTTP